MKVFCSRLIISLLSFALISHGQEWNFLSGQVSHSLNPSQFRLHLNREAVAQPSRWVGPVYQLSREAFHVIDRIKTPPQESSSWLSDLTHSQSVRGVGVFAALLAIGDVRPGALFFIWGVLLTGFLWLWINKMLNQRKWRLNYEAALKWAKTKFPTEVSGLQGKHLSSSNLRTLYNNDKYRQETERIGLMTMLTLMDVMLKGEGADNWDFIRLERDVFPFLRKEQFDLSDPNVALNRNVLIYAIELAVAAKKPSENWEDQQSGIEDYVVDGNARYGLTKAVRRIERSPLLRGRLGDPLPPKSPRLQIRDLYRDIVRMEQVLLDETQKWSEASDDKDPKAMQAASDVIALEHSRLEEADAKLKDLLALLPPDDLKIGDDRYVSPVIDPFPLRESIDPNTINPQQYDDVQEPLRRLVSYLAGTSDMKKPADAVVMFTSDLDGVPWGGVSRAFADHRVNRLLVVGGAGRYKPKKIETETKFFVESIETLGEDWSNPELVVVTEDGTTTTASHAEAAAQRITQGLDKSASLVIVVEHAPLMQLRAEEELRQAFKRLGYFNIEVTGDVPFFRDDKVAPFGWTLSQWRQRMAWDAVREPAKLLGARDAGRFSADFLIPLERLKDAMEVSERLLSDASIPQMQKLRVDGYRERISREITRMENEGIKSPKFVRPYSFNYLFDLGMLYTLLGVHLLLPHFFGGPLFLLLLVGSLLVFGAVHFQQPASPWRERFSNWREGVWDWILGTEPEQKAVKELKKILDSLSAQEEEDYLAVMGRAYHLKDQLFGTGLNEVDNYLMGIVYETSPEAKERFLAMRKFLFERGTILAAEGMRFTGYIPKPFGQVETPAEAAERLRMNLERWHTWALAYGEAYRQSNPGADAENIETVKRTIMGEINYDAYGPLLEAAKEIERLAQAGEINPTGIKLKLSRHGAEAQTTIEGRPARIDSLAMKGNPWQVDHIYMMLEAIVKNKLDKVVVMLDNSDLQDENLSALAIREPITRELLKVLEPFVEYAPIAKEEEDLWKADGERSFFRLMQFNRNVPIDWFYSVGSNHRHWAVEKKDRAGVSQWESGTAKKIHDYKQESTDGYAGENIALLVFERPDSKFVPGELEALRVKAGMPIFTYQQPMDNSSMRIEFKKHWWAVPFDVFSMARAFQFWGAELTDQVSAEVLKRLQNYSQEWNSRHANRETAVAA